MRIDQSKIDELIHLLKKKYPDWDSFSHPNFVKEEVEYKQKTIKKTQELLNENTFKNLLDENNYEEVLNRLEKIGKDNNLLYTQVPLQGDLKILYEKGLNKETFSKAVYDLLFGRGNSTERLKRYLDYINKNTLPNKWTFPTYFLFISYPNEEYFVKPETAKWFMEFLNKKDEWSSTPNPETYQAIRSTVYELKEALSQYKPRDIVDIQGFIWACHNMAKRKYIPKDKRDELVELFKEFASSYLKTKEAEEHTKMLKESREIGRKNFREVSDAEQKGEDITDKVLLKLLPYYNFEPLRKQGAWISIAPVINGNIKKWFENIGWTKPEDWSQISKAIFDFIKKCNENPNDLKKACEKFSELPYSKGFQAGFLSPILNALNPDEFKLINRKPVNVLNFLLNTSYQQTITEYPATNEINKRIIEEFSQEMHKFDLPKIGDDDLFDLFSHWLNAVKKYDFKEIQYWKISPGENARFWVNWRESSFITIGWGELGDVTKMNRSEFEKKRDELVKKYPDWTKTALEQVWKFAKHIKEGDKIIANKGISKAIGIGTVIGACNYKPNEDYAHRRLVQWEDIGTRKINEPGWQKTLVKLDKKKFDEIISIPPDESPPVNKESAFNPKTFHLLKELNQNPTRDFYTSKRNEFKQHVENPMRELLNSVAEELPDSITDIMETKSKIFSRIPKNDFGKGGAWDFYWGAFYPKGGKRIEDAQLFISIKKDRFEYGFHIGEYGSEQRAKFIKHCQDHFENLSRLLKYCLDDSSINYGERGELANNTEQIQPERTSVNWKEWLKNPDKGEIDASFALPKNDVLNVPKKELKNKILDGFKKLFPLVILASSDDPLLAINDYLEQIDFEPEIQPTYSLSEVSKKTGFPEDELERWKKAIERKGQAIFYGPPGTGKTFIARELGRHLIGGGDGFKDIVQFHPAYAYEDFIQGIRPTARPDGSLDYKMIRGRFLDFCAEAKKRQGPCVLIIDEINRANLARVFGELMYLLEYRNEEVPLAQGNSLSIPQNVRILGTMNTADRSIALVDHALRRRFSFISLYPNYKVLRNFHKNNNFPEEKLISVLEELNNEIRDKNYYVGISFFLDENLSKNIETVWKTEIEPYLEEYFFDQPEKVKNFRWKSVKDKIF